MLHLASASTPEGFSQEFEHGIELTTVVTVADNVSNKSPDVQATESGTIDADTGAVPPLEVVVQALEIFGAKAFENDRPEPDNATTGPDTAAVGSSDSGCRARWPVRMYAALDHLFAESEDSSEISM